MNTLKKIGEVAELLNTTPRTLRFYEEEGLVNARRTPKGTRLYSTEDIARFRAILQLAQAGIPLAFIKTLAITREQASTGAQASREVSCVLITLQSMLRGQIDMMRRLDSELTQVMRTIQGCSQCTHPPTRQGCPECPINQALNTSDILNLIWEQAVD